MMKKIVWITGASTGIGAETAIQLAAKGYNVMASARSADKLTALEEGAKDLEGSIHAYPCDVTDEKAIATTLSEIEKTHGPIDIAILNAGTYLPDTAQSFTFANFQKQYEINVFGVAKCIEPLLKTFIARKKGHIAITASVAGFRGLPRSISYGSGKAALINMAEALYLEAKPHGIKVQVITPGFVRTPLTDKNDFTMPMLMEVDDAAQALIAGLESERFEITFPWLFSFLTKLVGLLPDKAYFWVIEKVSAEKTASGLPK